jgi:uncharacterized Zn finger protein
MNTTGSTDTRARAILAAGAVTATNRAGIYRAQGSKPGQVWLCSTQGWCDCPAARYLEPGKLCKHVVAAQMLVSDRVRQQAAARGIRVLHGPSQAEPVGADVEPAEMYGPADEN